MNKIVRNIPNTITCANLVCGCLALVKAFEGDLVWTAYLVGIAGVLDFLDGFVARALQVSSPIGKDLDSLADMVTFGVVPGVVIYQLLRSSLSPALASSFFPQHYYNNPEAFSQNTFLTYLAFIIPVFSAIRLAKFNHDTRQTESFIGLPTPANAIFFCSLPLVLKQISDRISAEKNPFEMLVETSGDPILALLHNSWFLIALVVLFSFLLLAPLPLFSLKFKSFGWKGNEIRYVFLILSTVLIGFLQFVGIPLVIVLYILMSIINNLMSRYSK